MRVLFICDWDFTYLWEEVAKRLLARGVAKDCSALVIGRLYKEHLERSKSNVFSASPLLQDALEGVEGVELDWDRLKELEEFYSMPTLWRYVWADRSWVNCNYEEICKRLIATFNYYEQLYDTQRPEFIVTAGYGSMPHLVGHVVARRRGIPMYRPMHSRLRGRYLPGYSATEEIDWINEYISGERTAPNEVRDEVDNFISNFRERPVKPTIDSVTDHYFQFDCGGLYRFIRYIYRYFFSGSYANDHTKPNPLKKMWMEIMPRIKRRYYSVAKFWDRYDPDVNYIYYPLHLQPEASTMAMAPYYLDQISVIANLAKSVPIDYKIYVKEHPVMLGRRSRNYYNEIQQLPNVELVSPSVDNFRLIKNSKMVFTITGTAAIEAAILDRPAIMLGPGIPSYCPTVKYAGDVAPTKWSELIDMQLNAKFNDEDGLRRFLAGIFEHSFCCYFMEPNSAPDKVLAEENVEILVDVLTSEMDMLCKDATYGRFPLITGAN